MQVSKIILILLQVLLKILLEATKSMEDNGNVDADGVPLDDDYQKCCFFLVSIRQTIRDYKDETENN